MCESEISIALIATDNCQHIIENCNFEQLYFFLYFCFCCIVVLVSCGTLSVNGLESSLLSHDYCSIYIFMYSNVFSYIWGCQHSPGIFYFVFSV